VFLLMAIPVVVGWASEPLGTIVFLLLVPVCVVVLVGVVEPLAGTIEGRVVLPALGVIGVVALAGTVLSFKADKPWLALSAPAAAVMALGTVVMVRLDR